MNRILLISDSLGLPRNKPERVDYDETYFAKLKRANLDLEFVQMAYGGATLPKLLESIEYYRCFNPDLVFVQSGVVDCAPRALRKIERLLLGRLRIRLPKKTIAILRKYRGVRYTNPSLFRRSVRKMCAKFEQRPLYWVSVLSASDEWEKLVPGITDSVTDYNQILTEELGDRVLALESDASWTMSDFHHLNSFGHDCLFQQMNDVIRCHRHDLGDYST